MSRQDALGHFKMIGFNRLFGSIKYEGYVLTPPKPVAKSKIKKNRNLRELSPGFEPLMPVGSGEDA